MILWGIIILVSFLLRLLFRFNVQNHDDALTTGKQIIDDTVVTEKTAVMFDIDNTLIRGPLPCPSIIELCNYASSKNIKVILITARPNYARIRSFTERQLRKHGILYDQLFFCPPDSKKTLKKDLDLEFIFSVGDNWTDVDGSYGGKRIKLKKSYQ